jgi:uncharacterized protein
MKLKEGRMNWTRILGASVFLALSSVAFAAPSFDCAKASSSAEELVCSDEQLAALDRQLADRYADALKAIGSLEAGRDLAQKELKATQRGWIKGRDDCWKAEDVRDCVASSYLQRDAELVAEWMLQEPVAQGFYTCNGNPANEVVAFFFDTQLPALRLERGDTILTGWLVPAGSGSKYALSFGGSFWLKRKEATFNPDGTENLACVASE